MPVRDVTGWNCCSASRRKEDEEEKDGAVTHCVSVCVSVSTLLLSSFTSVCLSSDSLSHTEIPRITFQAPRHAPPSGRCPPF